MKILVVNGPNLNMLGTREPTHYGRETYADLLAKIQKHCYRKGIEVTFSAWRGAGGRHPHR